MEIFCKDLKDQAMKIINHEKKKIIPLTDEEKEVHEIKKFVINVKKNFVRIKTMKKNSEIIVIIQENIEEPPIVLFTQ